MRILPVLLLPFLVACTSPDPNEIARCPSGPPEGVSVPALPADLPPGDAARGATLYADLCVRCHAPKTADRESSMFRSYPRLDCPGYAEEVGPAWLHAVVADGGEVYGLDKLMKPFSDQLTPAQLADVVAFLQQESSTAP